MRMLLALLALTTLSGLAVADDRVAAKAAFSRGTKFYDLNRPAEALKEFEAAYFNYEEPAFLYNIAQCHRQLGHDEEAIKFYQTYLRKVPRAANRAEVEKKIAALEARAAENKAAAERAEKAAAEKAAAEKEQKSALLTPIESPMPKSAVATTTPLYKKWWLWTIVGVAAVGAAVGIGVGASQSGTSQTTFAPVHVP